MQKKKTTNGKDASAGKTLLFPVLAIALAMLVLVGALVYLIFALPKLTRGTTDLSPGAQPAETAAADGDAAQTLREYAAAQFPDYRFVSYDAETSVLTLEYSLNAEYAQLQKHGVAAGYAELAADTLFNAKLLCDGCQIDCRITVAEVIVRAVSSDGQEAYRASSLYGVTACWDN